MNKPNFFHLHYFEIKYHKYTSVLFIQQIRAKNKQRIKRENGLIML